MQGQAQFTHSISHRSQSQGHPQQVQFQPPQQSQGQDSQQFGNYSTQDRFADNRDSLIIDVGKSEIENFSVTTEKKKNKHDISSRSSEGI